MPTWRVLGAQWTPPIPKVPPPPPIVMPTQTQTPPPDIPPPPLPPPPPGLMPQYRSEKRRKLQDKTLHILQEPWNLNSTILSVQEECFQEYESAIESLNAKLLNREGCIYEHRQNITSLHKQLTQKNNLIRKKNHEISIIRNSNLTLQHQLESASLRIATEASEYEEKVEHYKTLIKGIQKTAESAEESAQYLRHMRKMLFEYEQGEALADSLKTTDRTCSICMETRANILCSPCMHLEYCEACAINAHDLNLGDFTHNRKCAVSSKCPRCKGDVNELIYIFT